MESTQETKQHFPLLDLTQYIASLFVILVHCGRLAESDFVHFTLKVFFARLAVPIFLVAAGYFFHSKQKKNFTYSRKYFKRQWRTYLFWSLIYLPYGIWFIQSLGISPKLYLAAIPVGLGYLGFCYHLWYFPALFLGFWLIKRLLKRFDYPIVFGICFLLFLLGATETYAGYLQGSKLNELYSLYTQVFITTRNGLFYTPIFLLLGFILADYSKGRYSFLRKNNSLKLGISLIFLAIESFIICLQEGTDKNFLFSLIPVSLFLVNLLLHSDFLKKHDFSSLRISAQYLYFLHPIFLELTKWSFARLGINSFQGIPLFLITFILTTFSIRILLLIKHYFSFRNNLSQQANRQKQHLQNKSDNRLYPLRKILINDESKGGHYEN